MNYMMNMIEEGMAVGYELYQDDPLMDAFSDNDCLEVNFRVDPYHYSTATTLPDVIQHEVWKHEDATEGNDDPCFASVNHSTLGLMTSFSFMARTHCVDALNGGDLSGFAQEIVAAHPFVGVVLPDELATMVSQLGNVVRPDVQSELRVPRMDYVTNVISGMDVFEGTISIPGFFGDVGSHLLNYAHYPSYGVAMQRLINSYIFTKTAKNIQRGGWLVAGSNARCTSRVLGYGPLERLSDRLCNYIHNAISNGFTWNDQIKLLKDIADDWRKIGFGPPIWSGCNGSVVQLLSTEHPEYVIYDHDDLKMARRYGFRRIIYESPLLDGDGFDFRRMNTYYRCSGDGNYRWWVMFGKR